MSRSSHFLFGDFTNFSLFFTDVQMESDVERHFATNQRIQRSGSDNQGGVYPPWKATRRGWAKAVPCHWRYGVVVGRNTTV